MPVDTWLEVTFGSGATSLSLGSKQGWKENGDEVRRCRTPKSPLCLVLWRECWLKPQSAT